MQKALDFCLGDVIKHRSSRILSLQTANFRYQCISAFALAGRLLAGRGQDCPIPTPFASFGISVSPGLLFLHVGLELD
jgi:hypothetical protein